MFVSVSAGFFFLFLCRFLVVFIVFAAFSDNTLHSVDFFVPVVGIIVILFPVTLTPASAAACYTCSSDSLPACLSSPFHFIDVKINARLHNVSLFFFLCFCFLIFGFSSFFRFEYFYFKANVSAKRTLINFAFFLL